MKKRLKQTALPYRAMSVSNVFSNLIFYVKATEIQLEIVQSCQKSSKFTENNLKLDIYSNYPPKICLKKAFETDIARHFRLVCFKHHIFEARVTGSRFYEKIMRTKKLYFYEIYNFYFDHFPDKSTKNAYF